MRGMSESLSAEFVAAVDLYVDLQQVLLKRLASGADPARVAVAMHAQLEQLQTAVRDHRACGGVSRP